jgi:hypothetical protein
MMPLTCTVPSVRSSSAHLRLQGSEDLFTGTHRSGAVSAAPMKENESLAERASLPISGQTAYHYALANC